jgi:hypothetical protein
MMCTGLQPANEIVKNQRIVWFIDRAEKGGKDDSACGRTWLSEPRIPESRHTLVHLFIYFSWPGQEQMSISSTVNWRQWLLDDDKCKYLRMPFSTLCQRRSSNKPSAEPSDLSITSVLRNPFDPRHTVPKFKKNDTNSS